MKLQTKKERAFKSLPAHAQLHIKLQKAKTDQDKFIECIHYAASIGRAKSKSNLSDIASTNLKIVMKLIQSYLNAGINPNANENASPALFHAVMYPELVYLLLKNGANPKMQNEFQSTPLHEAAYFLHSLYVEDLLKSAELLAASGVDINIENDEGKKPIDLIKNTLLLNKEQLSKIETRFKQITEYPRNINEIPMQVLEESPYSYLQLTETDIKNIALYNEEKYDQIIKPRGFYSFFEDENVIKSSASLRKLVNTIEEVDEDLEQNVLGFQ